MWQEEGSKQGIVKRAQPPRGLQKGRSQLPDHHSLAQRVRRPRRRSSQKTQATRAREQQAQTRSGRSSLRYFDLKRGRQGKLLSPARKREAVKHVRKTLGVSERRACRAICQIRSTQRYKPIPNYFKDELRQRVIEIASESGRYGYRQVTNLLNMEGWNVGKDIVYSIWREEGLKIPQKQPKRGRLWLADGSCIRRKALFANHVWSYDFVHDRTHDGKTFRVLNIIDEFSKECLATVAKRRLNSQDVILTLADLFIKHGCPTHIRSDNGPEFVAKKLMKWLLPLCE